MLIMVKVSQKLVVPSSQGLSITYPYIIASIKPQFRKAPRV